MPSAAQIERAILALLGDRSPDASICPSEAARALVDRESETWRSLMTSVREVAARMAESGRITITRKGVEVSPDAWGTGPVRLHRGDRFED